MNWSTWINCNWAGLVRGEKVPVPRHLSHPSSAGFQQVDIASPSGQFADWTMPMSDGSRIHVHEFADGSLVGHRDQHDPDRGLGPLLNHLLTETYVGPALLIAAIVVVARSSRGA